MSIATDEAEKRYPTEYWPGYEPHEGYRGEEAYLLGVTSSDLRDIYVAGRTAEPTAAEIEAAMDVIKIEVGDLTLSKELAKDALYAARKAVTK